MARAIPTLLHRLNTPHQLASSAANSYISYDRANRLLQVTDGTTTTTYRYDGLGNRISQDVNGLLTRYLLDIQPGLAVDLAETTGANIMRNIHTPRGIHAHKDTGGAWEWMLQDGLGSVRGVVDNSVGVLESRNYDPYGELFGVTGSSQTAYGFTGEQTDDNGLLYLRARYYDPAAGVFTARDPFEGRPCDPMSLNGYSYVAGNPINMVDPSGMIYELPSMWASCVPSIMPVNYKLPICLDPENPFCGVTIIPGTQFPSDNPFDNITISPIQCPPNDPFCWLAPPDDGEEDDPPVGVPPFNYLQLLCALGDELSCALLTQSEAQEQGCPPCPRPNPACVVNRVPPGHPHPPCAGDHYHAILVEQRKSDCKCFEKRQSYLTTANCLPQGGIPPNPPCDTWI